MKWTFKCKEHQEYGSVGWVLANIPAFDPLFGMAVSHDVLEHWPNDDSTTGELMALGAMIHVRGEEYFHQAGKVYTRPSYHFSGELGELMLKIQWGEWVSLKQYPKTSAHTDDDFAREEIAEGVRLAARHITEEHNDLYPNPTAKEWANVSYWLTHGYNKARQRYKDIDRYRLLEIFCEIESKADEALKTAEAGITELIVSLTWKRGYMSDSRYPTLIIRTNEDEY